MKLRMDSLMKQSSRISNDIPAQKLEEELIYYKSLTRDYEFQIEELKKRAMTSVNVSGNLGNEFSRPNRFVGERSLLDGSVIGGYNLKSEESMLENFRRNKVI